MPRYLPSETRTGGFLSGGLLVWTLRWGTGDHVALLSIGDSSW